jgi:hypothetical protein
MFVLKFVGRKIRHSAPKDTIPTKANCKPISHAERSELMLEQVVKPDPLSVEHVDQIRLVAFTGVVCSLTLALVFAEAKCINEPARNLRFCPQKAPSQIASGLITGHDGEEFLKFFLFCSIFNLNHFSEFFSDRLRRRCTHRSRIFMA